MEWFYLPDDSDDKQGPFTTVELKQKYKATTIHDSTYVWNQDLPEWKEINDLTSLKRELQARAPPAGLLGALG